MPYQKPQERCYTDMDMISALAEIKDGKTFRSVSEKYKIPLSTLSNKASGKYDIEKTKGGPPPALTSVQEQALITFITEMSKIGYDLTKKQIALIVKDVLDKAEAQNPESKNERKFKDNLPSIGWVYRFMNRFPELSSSGRNSQHFNDGASDCESKIDNSVIQNESRIAERTNLSYQERVGFRLAIKVFENTLPGPMRNEFLRIWDNKNSESEPESLVWRIYKNLRQREQKGMEYGESSVTDVSNQSDFFSVNANDGEKSSFPITAFSSISSHFCGPLTNQMTTIPTSSSLSKCLSPFSPPVLPSSSTLTPPTSSNESTLNKSKSHDNCEVTSSNKFLKISDNLRLTRKVRKDGSSSFSPTLDNSDELDDDKLLKEKRKNKKLEAKKQRKRERKRKKTKDVVIKDSSEKDIPLEENNESVSYQYVITELLEDCMD